MNNQRWWQDRQKSKNKTKGLYRKEKIIKERHINRISWKTRLDRWSYLSMVSFLHIPFRSSQYMHRYLPSYQIPAHLFTWKILYCSYSSFPYTLLYTPTHVYYVFPLLMYLAIFLASIIYNDIRNTYSALCINMFSLNNIISETM